MGSTHPCLLHHRRYGRLRSNIRLHRRHLSNRLQPNTGKPTSLIRAGTATILWTTTATSILPATSTCLPTMRHPTAIKRTLLPQLRQTTILNEKAKKRFFGNFLFHYKNEEKNKLYFLALNSILQGNNARKFFAHQKLDECSACCADVADFVC